MREAVIILPEHQGATKWMRRTLLNTFGGYTEHKADGAWRDPADGKVYHDKSSVFTIGVDDVTGGHMPQLRNIAMKAGNLGRQISVYLKGFDGNVEFVNCDHWSSTDDAVLAIETIETLEDT